MKTRTTVAIFLVAAALAAFVYFYDLRHNPSGGASSGVPKQTFAVAADAINSVNMQHAGTTIAFIRRDGDWYLTQPVVTRGDQPRVTFLVNQIAAMQTERTISATPDRVASFGLEHPQLALDFTTQDGKQYSIRMGAADFSQTSVYAQVGGNSDVSLVTDTILNALSWSTDDFRDHTVLDVSMSDVTSFQLTNTAGEIDAVKQDSGWAIIKPRNAAQDLEVKSLLDTVRLARVSKFVSETSNKGSGDLAKYGLDKPTIKLRLTIANAPPASQSIALEIGKKIGNEYYARDTSRPIIFTVQQDVYQALDTRLSVTP